MSCNSSITDENSILPQNFCFRLPIPNLIQIPLVVPKTTLADVDVVAKFRIICRNSRHWWFADRTETVGKPRFGNEGADNGEE
jgi:hypothetical protein